MLFFILFLVRKKRRRRTAAVLNYLKNKESGVKKEMKELAKEFIGKDCIIYTVTEGQVMGKVAQVGESAVLLERDDGSREAVNLDLVVRLREHPVGKNGKKKSAIFD